MHEGNRIVLAVPEAVLGRVASCDVQVTHPLVSRRHCRVQADADGIFVEDLGSSNGTYVNGGRAAGRVRMCIGDILRIGQEGPEFRLIAGVFGGRDVATVDPEAMEKTMMPGDAGLAALAAQVRVAPAAAPAPPPETSEARTREVGVPQTTGSIPVAMPMEATGASHDVRRGAARADRRAAPEGEVPTVDVSPPAQAPPDRSARAHAPKPVSHEAAPTTESIEEPRTTGFVPGLVVGFVLGVILVAAAAVFTPWGDTLRGWPDETHDDGARDSQAPSSGEDGR